MNGRGRPHLAVLLALLAAGCRRVPEPFGAHTAFLPVVFWSRAHGHIPWAARLTLTTPEGTPAVVRLTRWPPDTADAEEELIDLPGGTTRRVPVRTPPSTAASFYFESRSPFSVRASIVDRRGLVPDLAVPVLTREDLARPGDSLLLGPIVSNDAERGHFGFTFPGVDQGAAPYRVRVRLTAPGGGALLHESTFVLPGLPLTIEDPWKRFGLAAGTPFNVAVTFLGGVRGRAVATGLWVYGVISLKATGTPRFLATRVERASAAH
jgi:hypothetical protein